MVSEVCVSSWAGDVVAEPDEEIFDLLDGQGHVIGTAPRAKCHAEGLWHQSVYVMVFNPAGQLLIQRRSLDKRVYPGRWDLSAAEHLSAGETYQQGVVRGLQEEVGVHLSPDCQVNVLLHHDPPLTGTGGHAAPLLGAAGGMTQQLTGPLTARHQRKLDLPEISVKDYEFVETWRLDNWQGSEVKFNVNEVSEVQWVTVEDLAARMKQEPEAFTPWFLDEARLVGLLTQD